MADQVRFEVYLFSPRWGIYSTYEICLSHQNFRMGLLGENHTAICTWNEYRLPTWSTTCTELTDRNPLENVLEKDLIYPPTIFVRALEVAWRAWHVEALDDEQVEYEIKQVCEWVNLASAARPRSDFWRRIF